MADKFVTMHGKALDGSDEIHQQEVHEGNVEAFKRSGWVVGEKEFATIGVTYSEEDAREQAGLVDDYPETEPKTRKKVKK